MITKNTEIHNADMLIYAIIKCAVDDYKTELNGVRGEDIVEALKEKDAKRKAKRKF